MNELVDIVGLEHVGEAAGVVTVAPGSTEETAAVMRVCSEGALVVSARGGGTKMEWGNAVAAQVIVDTRRLAGVREHSWGDLTATVGAGTPWAEMERELAMHGQRVALDPLFAETATVGGVIAVNNSGALRMRYGSLRDLVIGMTIVLADGTIARSGGKVVKNVAGYDLPKLLIGSFGTLGIITEVNFRLHPVQLHSASFRISSGKVEQLADLMSAIFKTSLSLEAMQLRNSLNSFVLDVQLAAMPDPLIEQEVRLRSLAQGLEFEGLNEVRHQMRGMPSEFQVKDLHGAWRLRDALLDKNSSTTLKITALPSKLASLVAGFARLSAMKGWDSRCVADPIGILTTAVSAPAAELVALVDDLRARLIASGGTVVVLRRGDLPGSVDAWGPVPPAIELMRAVKQQFDPERLLNPGKFVGGI